MGGLEEFAGLNVMLCLVNVLIAEDESGVALCRDPVPSRPADDSRTSCLTEELPVWAVIRGWSSTGGCIIDIWSGVRMSSLDLELSWICKKS